MSGKTDKPADDKPTVTPEMLYAGSDNIADADLFSGDRGDMPVLGANLADKATPDDALEPDAAAKAAAELPDGDKGDTAGDAKATDNKQQTADAGTKTAKTTEDDDDPAESVKTDANVGDQEPPVGNKKQFLERLAAKNRKIQALEAQLRDSKVAKPAEKTPDAAASTAETAATAEIERISAEIKDLRKKSMEAQMDGKLEDAATFQEQLEAKLEERILAKARLDQSKVIEEARKATRQDRESETMDQVVNELVAEHPELDGDALEYDEDLVAMINAAATRRVQKDGMTGPEALRAAAEAVFGRFKAPKTPAVETKAPAKKGLDVAAALAAAEKQPAAPTASSAARTTTKVDTEVDIMNMPESDFLKLSSDQLAVLRGDSL